MDSSPRSCSKSEGGRLEMVVEMAGFWERIMFCQVVSLEGVL